VSTTSIANKYKLFTPAKLHKVSHNHENNSCKYFMSKNAPVYPLNNAPQNCGFANFVRSAAVNIAGLTEYIKFSIIFPNLKLCIRYRRINKFVSPICLFKFHLKNILFLIEIYSQLLKNLNYEYFFDQIQKYLPSFSYWNEGNEESYRMGVVTCECVHII